MVGEAGAIVTVGIGSTSTSMVFTGVVQLPKIICKVTVLIPGVAHSTSSVGPVVGPDEMVPPSKVQL